MAQATLKHGEGRMVDYTPSGAAVSAGDVVVVGDIPFVAHSPIADGDLGALSAGGCVYLMTAGEAISAGKKVYWDDSNNKVVETATTGKHFGYVVPSDSASGDADTCLVLHAPECGASTPAATVAALTDSTGGTANGTLEDGTATYSQTLFNNNFADVAAKIAAILTALKNAGLMATS